MVKGAPSGPQSGWAVHTEGLASGGTERTALRIAPHFLAVRK
jgi:hypothetical protein